MKKRTVKLLILPLTFVLVLLCGCFSTASTNPSSEATAPEDATGYIQSILELEKELEAFRTIQQEQNDAYEARLAELERALAAYDGGKATAITTDFLYEVTDSGILLTGWNGTAKTLEIPATLDGKPVVAIGDGAFRDSEVECVTVPNGVISIGWFAFSGCYRLSTVSLPASVTAIGYGAFEHCASAIRFLCPSGSYASQYAASYGYQTVSQ